MSRKTRGTWITVTRLIKIFQRIKRSPKKIFLASDFGTSIQSRSHLHTLEKLGLIEQVPAYYQTGKKHRTRREIRGYKLL